MLGITDIIATLLGILVAVVPAAVLIIRKVHSVSKEVGELFVAVTLALEDGKLTGDEIRNIIKEGKDVISAVATIREKTIERG